MMNQGKKNGIKLMQNLIITHTMARNNWKVSSNKLSNFFSEILIQLITNDFQSKQNESNFTALA